MNITEIECPSHERVVQVVDEKAGLHAFIAVHSTHLGPSAGGLRMRPYGDTAEAIDDVLRLSRGMTFKNAAAELPLGGGKAVILGDPMRDKTPALMAAFGRAVERLGGSYWTAEDMGMTPADMTAIAKETAFVAGLPDGAHASGDPSPVTARGILNAIRTTARHRFGSADLHGLRVAVQGLGNVGRHLCALLHEAGAQLTVADVDRTNIRKTLERSDAVVIAPEDILAADADIFAPCAIGGILNKTGIAALRVGAVAGGANNQLATAQDGQRLHDRGILGAPDFVANGGGIVNVASEILRIEDRDSWVADKLVALDQTMDRILSRAIAQNLSPVAVAEATVADGLRQKAA